MNIINLALDTPSAFSAVLVLEKRRSAKFQRVWRDGTAVITCQERLSQKNWPRTQDDGLSKLEEVTRVYVLDSMIQAKMYKMYMKNPG